MTSIEDMMKEDREREDWHRRSTERFRRPLVSTIDSRSIADDLRDAQKHEELMRPFYKDPYDRVTQVEYPVLPKTHGSLYRAGEQAYKGITSALRKLYLR